jgi:predicted sugar kinase
MVYDFDGTLSPQPMQEYTVLPKIRVKPKEFWREVSKESEETVSESMLVYMRLLLQKANETKIHIGRRLNTFTGLGCGLLGSINS